MNPQAYHSYYQRHLITLWEKLSATVLKDTKRMSFHQWFGLLIGIGGLFIYAVFVYWQTQILSRQTKIMQESEWIPEGILDAENEVIYFTGKRPWYPRFRISLGGRNSDWLDNFFWPGHIFEEKEDMELAKNNRGEPVKVDWYTKIPQGVGDFLNQFDSGDYEAKLEFQFQTWTGEEYLMEFDLHLRVFSDAYKESIGREYQILEYPDMNLTPPWEKNENYFSKIAGKML